MRLQNGRDARVDPRVEGAANTFSTFLERNENSVDGRRAGPSTSAAAAMVPFAPEFAVPRPIVVAAPTHRGRKRVAADMDEDLGEDPWAEWGSW
jgi:hypothetical protein